MLSSLSLQLLKSLKRLSELPITVDILVVRAVKSLVLSSCLSSYRICLLEKCCFLEQDMLPKLPAPM